MKNMILLLGLLLCLCVSSWGACVSLEYGTEAPWGGTIYRCGCPGTTDVGKCPQRPVLNGKVYFDVRAELVMRCDSRCSGQCGGERCDWQSCYYWAYCDTQGEVDSVQIAQECTSGTVVDSTISGNKQYFCQNGDGLLFGFWNFSTNVHSSSIKYYIHTSTGYEEIDEGTYNHLAAQACTEVSLYRGVLNGKYVYWYSTDPEPAGVVNVVRIK